MPVYSTIFLLSYRARRVLYTLYIWCSFEYLYMLKYEGHDVAILILWKWARDSAIISELLWSYA